MNEKIYNNPLIYRYEAKKMGYIFSLEKRFKTWRRLWIALAKEQQRLGLGISEEQIQELVNHKDDINYEDALKYEKKNLHEVMSHIHAYGKQCPNAKKIIHLGATSAYVMDNTDLIQMKEALYLIKNQLVNLIYVLKEFCLEYKDKPTLGYTHYQPAQPTTVGKRASLWLQDLVYDYYDLIFRLDHLPFLGVKGATGSQASFLNLFDGDSDKVESLDLGVAQKMGFDHLISVTGQTYSRKIDYAILAVLSGLAQSSHKFSNDIRLLQNLGELQEPFRSSQVGSSAMPYKKNPIISERIASLSRYVINQTQNPAFTFANQWLERTLDDSANRRISIPESFLACYVILDLYHFIVKGLQVNSDVIQNNFDRYFSFMVTENILMQSVQLGADRQDVHDTIREYSIQFNHHVDQSIKGRSLLNSLIQNQKIPLKKDSIPKLSNPKSLTGLCSQQVEQFIQKIVNPILSNNSHSIDPLYSPNIQS